MNHKLNDPDQPNVNDNIRHIIQSFNEGFFVIDQNWFITSFNPAFQAITGLSTGQLKDLNFRQLVTLGISDEVMAELEIAFTSNIASHVQYFNTHFKRWLRLKSNGLQDNLIPDKANAL